MRSAHLHKRWVNFFPCLMSSDLSHLSVQRALVLENWTAFFNRNSIRYTQNVTLRLNTLNGAPLETSHVLNYIQQIDWIFFQSTEGPIFFQLIGYSWKTTFRKLILKTKNQFNLWDPFNIFLNIFSAIFCPFLLFFKADERSHFNVKSICVYITNYTWTTSIAVWCSLFFNALLFIQFCNFELIK